MQREQIIGRFGRLTECGRVIDFSVRGGVLRLHAQPRGAELPRPRQQRAAPEGRRTAFRGQCLAAPGRPESLSGRVPGLLVGAMPGDRRLLTGRSAGVAGPDAGLRYVHALPRDIELARPHRRFPGTAWLQGARSRHSPGLADGPHSEPNLPPSAAPRCGSAGRALIATRSQPSRCVAVSLQRGMPATPIAGCVTPARIGGLLA
jgi:hypothetical protein